MFIIEFNFLNSNLMTSIIFAHKIGNADTVKILSFIKSSHPKVFRSAILFKKRDSSTGVFLWRKRKHFFAEPPVAASVLWQWSFLFSMWRLSSFLNFMKTWLNFTKTTLREVWPWHSRSKICKINGKSGLKFCKLIFCG